MEDGAALAHLVKFIWRVPVFDLSPSFRAVVMRGEGRNRWMSRASRTLSG
jgi:hypothetical protein